jgi:hypothetical protein
MLPPFRLSRSSCHPPPPAARPRKSRVDAGCSFEVALEGARQYSMSNASCSGRPRYFETLGLVHHVDGKD